MIGISSNVLSVRRLASSNGPSVIIGPLDLYIEDSVGVSAQLEVKTQYGGQRRLGQTLIMCALKDPTFRISHDYCSVIFWTVQLFYVLGG